jgi:hypothetical protein
VFAQEVVKQQGLDGDEARHYAADLGGRVQSLVKQFQLDLVEARQRQRTSSELELLLDGIAQTGTTAGKLIAEHRATISEAFRGVELARMSDGMGVLSAWLRNPSGEKLVKELLDQLYAAMGTSPTISKKS